MLNAINWHFNIYEQDTSHPNLNLALISFITLGQLVSVILLPLLNLGINPNKILRLAKNSKLGKYMPFLDWEAACTRLKRKQNKITGSRACIANTLTPNCKLSFSQKLIPTL